MQHLLQQAQPPAYIGQWESRITAPFAMEDHGPLSAPVLVDVQGPDLQSIIDAWSAQPAIHALSEHSGAFILQLKRYTRAGDRAAKNTTPVLIRPGDALVMPCFAAPGSIELQHRQFRVAFVIHHGEQTTSGHYQTALSCPLDSLASAWQFYICNDGTEPRCAASADLRDILHNAYLVGLVRGDHLACH